MVLRITLLDENNSLVESKFSISQILVNPLYLIYSKSQIARKDVKDGRFDASWCGLRMIFVLQNNLETISEPGADSPNPTAFSSKRYSFMSVFNILTLQVGGLTFRNTFLGENNCESESKISMARNLQRSLYGRESSKTLFGPFFQRKWKS